MLFYQIVQGNEHSLLTVFEHIRLGEFIDIVRQQICIRIIAAGQEIWRFSWRRRRD